MAAAVPEAGERPTEWIVALGGLMDASRRTMLDGDRRDVKSNVS